jgi:ABC-type lipoprotein release transport system permease subunit
MAVAALALGLCPAAGAQSAPFAEDCRRLTAFPTRVAGSEGGERAADYIGSRLRAMKPDLVITQAFATVRERTLRCDLLLEAAGSTGVVRRLYAMRSNGAIPPVTPPEGIAGPLAVVGGGSREEFLDRTVHGAIAVMDYNNGDGWLRALRLGARAVVFVRRGPLSSASPNFTDANVNLPRFFYDGDPADLPDGARATIHSLVAWEPAVGRNVLALFKGTAPTFDLGQEEAVVLAAPFDSYGAVPDLARGARGAANVAALLQLAEGFGRQRPRRHVLIAAFDSQAMCHLGASRFYVSLEKANDKAEVTVASRRRYLEEEAVFLDRLLKLLAQPRPLQQAQSPERRELRRHLSDRAAHHAYAVAKEVFLLRTARSADPRNLEERARLEAVEDRWNRLRRALGWEDTASLEPEVAACLAQIASEVRAAAEARRGELALERAEIESAERIRAALGERWISLHVSLLLGDAAPRWGLAIGGDSPLHAFEDSAGQYGKVQDVFLRTDRELLARGRGPTHFETATASKTLPEPRVIWGGGAFVHSGEVAGLFGVYNLALATCHEPAEHEGTPDDVLENLDMGRIEEQARGIGKLLAGVADLEVEPAERGDRSASAPRLGVVDQEGLSLRRGIVAGNAYVWTRFEGGIASGAMAMSRQGGSPIANIPLPGAIVHARMAEPQTVAYQPVKPPGFRDFQVLRTDGNGTYVLGPLSMGAFWGLRGAAFLFGPDGQVRAVSDQESYGNIRQRLNLLDCRPNQAILPPVWTAARPQTLSVSVLSAVDNSALNDRKSYREFWDGVLAWYSDGREDRFKISGLPALMQLGVGPQTHAAAETAAAEPQGGARRAAPDLWQLNESRLATLHAKDIRDDSLSEQHGRSEDLMLSAAGQPLTLRSEALNSASFLGSQPVYTRLRATLDDLVFAVLILLGLAVPFAFAMERVVIGATTIGRQIAWFGVFFALTFVTLYYTHPAFAIAATPVIIFLGFAILVLSVMVISVLMRRFEEELKAIQGMPATIHSDDVSRVGTLMAAVQMGISTMRRRPMRTALTAVTITLLTFTILSFASFGTRIGVLRTHLGPMPAYHGIFMRHVNWNPVAPSILDTLWGRWGGEAAVFARRWVSPRERSEAGLLLSRADATGGVTVRGVAGFDPGEIARRPDLAQLLDADLDGKVQMTQPMARTLGVRPGDTVRLAGRVLTVGRLLDGSRLTAVMDLDNSSILPADFTEVRTTRPPTADAFGIERESPVGWTALPADAVVIVSDSTAQRLGARLQAVTLYPVEPEATGRIAADLARMLPLPVAATVEGGAYRHMMGVAVAASGMGDLLFPLLLGGLVVFGTMLGSVADREREIYTFSALGLAPRHVAMLFLAESVVYAVIGGMGGYLLANFVLRALHFAAARGWAVAPEMNMSSTNTIVTILIVMATVLASAVYPALRASRSANPGLMRTWRPPAPQGDLLDMVFPFTVSAYDITGIVSFLREHFGSHNDTGLGRFMARETRLERAPDGLLGLGAEISLAPFDLGVRQSFLLSSAPSPIPGVDEVRIRLQRQAGQPKDWVRLNRGFLDNLRQQFLIWRSLPEATMELYRARTLAEMKELADAQG